jgi:hypothetical protein
VCARPAKLVPVGFGIKKLQITCVIEDAKVESMDAVIEDQLVRCARASAGMPILHLHEYQAQRMLGPACKACMGL